MFETEKQEYRTGATAAPVEVNFAQAGKKKEDYTGETAAPLVVDLWNSFSHIYCI